MKNRGMMNSNKWMTLTLNIMMVIMTSTLFLQVNAQRRNRDTTAMPTILDGAEPWEALYRIPTNTVPIHYDLYLYPKIEEGSFSGNVAILINLLSSMDYLVVHVNELNITSTKLQREDNQGSEVALKSTFEYKPNEFWVVRPINTLLSGNYTLKFEFNGRLDKHLVGFYKSVYLTKSGEKRAIATSQFQATDARRAFPCFDEPSFKSTFTITLVRPSDDYIALSNMPVMSEEINSPIRGMTEVQFNRSFPMVTYLVAVIVCDFQFVEGLTREGKKFRVYASKDQIGRANYSLQIGIHILNYFEEYFGINYPLPKQDMIAIPDFAFSAMENWGLITYRESASLYDSVSSSSANRQRVATIVSHELAHMWFGNLATLNWWTDLWLNEGFASYIEFKGASNFHPDWEMEAQFLVEDLQVALALDDKYSSHPIVQEVNHPNEISELFDLITYRKGSSILRMLENFMGEDDFKQGISNFLRKYQFGNAVTKDLWNELTDASSTVIDVAGIMNTWTRQMGYPVIHVSLSSKELNKLEIRQKRFVKGDPSDMPEKIVSSPYNYTWDIPVTYYTSNELSKEQAWLNRDMEQLEVSVPCGSTWIKFNIDHFGYYRVNYDVAIWNQLIAVLNDDHTVLSPSDRSGLLDDAFSLASAGILDYTTAMGTTKYLNKERHYVPWKTISKKLNEIGFLLMRTTAYPIYREYVVNLVAEHMRRVQWEDVGSHLDKRNRVTILTMACHYGFSECLKGAETRFKDWIKDSSNTVPANFRDLVYKYGVQQTGSAEWEELLTRYLKEINAQEKSKMLTGLASSKHNWIIHRLLYLSKNDTVIKTQDYFKTLENLAYNPSGTYIIWTFLRDNWEYLVDRFTLKNSYLGRMVKRVTTQFTTEHELKMVKKFFDKYPNAGAGKRARSQSLEEIQESINWIKRNKDDVMEWLKPRTTLLF